jgi:hypothetical protein
MSRARAEARGQALVEAALGMLVFVTILLFGIHFAEVGFLSLKVEEAANSALFDATAAKMHDTYAKDFGVYRKAVNAASAGGTQRYQDWDGRASKTGGAVNLTQAVTRGTPLNVACGEARAQLPSFAPGPRGQAGFSPPYPGGAIGDSAMLCTATTTLTPFNIPRRFLENEPFQAQHLQETAIVICAGARSKNGNCAGSYGILLDDWGFSGEAEGLACPLAKEGGTSCTNQGYYKMVNAIYDANGGGQGNAGSALAAKVAGSSPINEGHFYLSFQNIDSAPAYTQQIPSHKSTLWKTSPFEVEGAYRARRHCWLGQDC